MAGQLTKTIKNIIECDDIIPLVIDITTFTHEALLMLLKLIYDNKKHFIEIYCLYNGAKEYSVGDSPEHMWLSKGCRDIRNVIGYPGKIFPASKNRLILLTGFEIERATRLIELVEPDIICMGNAVDSTSDNHNDAREHFKVKFMQWKDNYKNNCEVFEFLCKDIDKTVEAIDEIVNSHTNENHIIVPLNTKLSTISTALVAFQNQRIQVCYSIPEIYNTKNYSSPSETITVVPLHTAEAFS
jgi:hypothetical protein